VIAAEQDFGHRPAAEFGGARVVGEVEEKVTGDRLALSGVEG